MHVPTKEIVKFQDMDLEMLTLHGRRCFTAETIGKALQYSEPRKHIINLFNRNRDEFEEEIDYGVLKLRTPGGIQDVIVFYQTGVNLIGMFSEQPLAKAFRRWAKHVLSTAQQSHNFSLHEMTFDSEPQNIGRTLEIKYLNFLEKYAIFLEQHIRLLKSIPGALNDEKIRESLEKKSKRRWARCTPEEMKIIRDMYLAGFSQNLIGETLGRSHSFVGYKLQQMGLIGSDKKEN